VGRPEIISSEIRLIAEIKKVFPEVVEHFQRAYPAEACCIIASGAAGPAVFVAQNSSKNPEFFFEINPIIFVHIEDLGLEVCAIAHSHPDGDAAPSLADLDGWFFKDAQEKRTLRFPGVLYIVAAITAGRVEATLFRSESGTLVEAARLFAGETESA